MDNIILSSIDPGLAGGLCIFNNGSDPSIYAMPLMKVKKSNGKIKQVYDLNAIVKILKPFQDKNVIMAIE